MEADLHELVENISLTIEHKEVRDRGLQPIKVQSGGTLNDLFHVIWGKYHRSSWIPNGSSWTKQQLLEKDYGDYVFSLEGYDSNSTWSIADIKNCQAKDSKQALKITCTLDGGPDNGQEHNIEKDVDRADSVNDHRHLEQINLDDYVLKKELEKEIQRQNEKLEEEQSKQLKKLKNEIKEGLDDCKRDLEQRALKEECNTKSERLQQRTSQAIDTMKREAKEEREEIAKRLEAMIEKMQSELEEKNAEQDGRLNHFIEVERTLKSQISEQKTMIQDLERKTEKLKYPCAYLCYGPMLTESDNFQLSQFDIDDQDYRRVNANFQHFHVNVFDECFRAIVLDVRKEGEEIIDIICRSFGIQNSGEYELCTKEQKRLRDDKHGANESIDLKKALEDEINDSCTKPRLLYLCKKKDHTSAIDESDVGQHTNLIEQVPPPNDDIEIHHTADRDEQLPSPQQQTDIDLQSQLQNWNFHTMWMGIVQGAYIIDRESAIELAALLTLIYYDRDTDNLSNSLLDYNVEAFLPEMYRGDHRGRISAADIYKKRSDLIDNQREHRDYIAEVVTMCSKLHGCYGLFYDVSVEEKTKVMRVIPKHKIKSCLFGITQYGVVKVNSRTGKAMFIRQFSEITKFGCKENKFWLCFEGWRDEFYAFTSQSREIIETLECFMSIITKAKGSAMSVSF